MARFHVGVGARHRREAYTLANSFKYEGATETFFYSDITDAERNATIHDGKDLKSKTSWDHGVLKVKTTESGAVTLESYALAPDGAMTVSVMRPNLLPALLSHLIRTRRGARSSASVCVRPPGVVRKLRSSSPSFRAVSRTARETRIFGSALIVCCYFYGMLGVEVFQSTTRLVRFGSCFADILCEFIEVLMEHRLRLVMQLMHGPYVAFSGPLIFITEPIAFAFLWGWLGGHARKNL